MANNETTGCARPLRFGVVAPLGTDLAAWRDQVRRIADSGYSTLLMPDLVRDAVTSLRDLDGPDLHTPVVMAVRGPKARALAIDLADPVTLAAMPSESRAEMMRIAADFRAVRDVEFALHVPVVGDAVSPFMAPPDTDPAALCGADSLFVLPSEPTAAIEEVLRRREEGGFSNFVIGANAADALAPVVAELTGH